LIKGLVFETSKGDQFLQAVEIQQAGTVEFQPTGAGKWMPFDGGSHNGGLWLHPVQPLPLAIAASLCIGGKPLTDMPPAELKQHLAARGLPVSGKKKDCLRRLAAALLSAGAGAEGQ
jgi:hypothetical protein